MSEYQVAETVQDEVLNFLLSAPTPEQVTAFHVSDAAQARLRYLLEANRNGSLTDSERLELEEASQLNHLFTQLKIRAWKLLEKP